MLQEEELTYKIRGCVFEVYRTLGHGFLESVYQAALLHELQAVGFSVEREVPLKDKLIGSFKADIVVEQKVLLELKAQRALPPHAEAQLLNYLKATGMRTGLLINFAAPKATVKRFVL